MQDLTRRRFLVHTSVVGGAAIAGAAALQRVGVTTQADAQPTPDTRPDEKLSSMLPDAMSLAGPMVVHVRDVATSEIAVLVGTQEIVYRDPELVTRLMHTAQLAAIVEG